MEGTKRDTNPNMDVLRASVIDLKKRAAEGTAIFTTEAKHESKDDGQVKAEKCNRPRFRRRRKFGRTIAAPKKHKKYAESATHRIFKGAIAQYTALIAGGELRIDIK